MLTAKLILERLDREGKLLERRVQPSKSFVLQFIDMLYIKHAQVDRNVIDITNTARLIDYDHEANANLMVASTPGHASFGKDSYGRDNIEGQDIGIQLGVGTTAPVPTNYKMETRINHGRSGEAGVKADFLNPSFETGDLTNWVAATVGGMAATVSNAAWALKAGTWFCTLLSTGARVTGDYAQVSQNINLTNITHIRFQLRYQGVAQNVFHFEVLVDGQVVYGREMTLNTDYADQIADVGDYTGIRTVSFRCTATAAGLGYANEGAWIDNVETLNEVQLEYGGTEIDAPVVAGASGEFTIRRYFTNASAKSITINEVGIQTKGQPAAPAQVYAFLIARDVVSPGVALDIGQILRVTYVPEITV